MELTEILFLLGRVIFGGYFLMGGVQHFTKLTTMKSYAASRRVPAPGLAIIGSGVLLIIGGAGIFLGVYVQWAVAALAFFLLPVTFVMHNFWSVSDPSTRMSEMINFTKNMALLGAALMLLAVPVPWIYSVL